MGGHPHALFAHSLERPILRRVVNDQNLGLVELTEDGGIRLRTRSIVVSALYATMKTSSRGFTAGFMVRTRSARLRPRSRGRSV